MPNLKFIGVEHDPFSFSYCLVDEKERVRCYSTLLFGITVPLHDSGEGSNGHTVRRVLLCVDPNSFSTLARSFSRSLARRENYTLDIRTCIMSG